jgi:glycosyltransferase involved in cell wall biosynthesis
MRILYITEIYPDVKHGLGVWGGGEKQFYEISRRVAKRGHDVSVLTCRFTGQPKEETVDGVRVFRAGLSRDPRHGGARKEILPVLLYILRTAKRASALRPDLIHCNTYFPVYAGKVASQLQGVPLITTFHDIYRLSNWIDDQGSLFWGLMGHAVTLGAARLAHGRIIAVSPQVKEKLIAIGLKAQNITVIPNGVDLKLFDSAHIEKAPHQVLYVGRLIRLKHVDRLMYAFAEVKKHVPEATLKIVGDGPERAYLQRLAHSLGLEGKVVFTGVTPTYEAVASHFKQSSVFVLPSSAEGESVASKEAMAAGLPVIAMKINGSGVLSIVQDGKNGFLVEPSESHLLAERIIELLQDEQKRRTMGDAARKFVESCDWMTIADRTMQVYKNAMRNA